MFRGSIRGINLDSTPEFGVSLRIPSELLEQDSKPAMCLVVIWVELRCFSKKRFRLLTVPIVSQQQPQVEICLFIRFIELDCFTEYPFGIFLFSEPNMRRAKQA